MSQAAFSGSTADGIGLKDLMAAAGITQGAFYKQFASKDDLAAQASKRALESISEPMVSRIRRQSKGPARRRCRALFEHGSSRTKRRRLSTRCARLRCCPPERGREGIIRSRDQKIPRHARGGGWGSQWRRLHRPSHGRFSTMVGALVLSRAVNNKRLAKRFLQAGAKSVMGLSAGAAQKGQLR